MHVVVKGRPLVQVAARGRRERSSMQSASKKDYNRDTYPYADGTFGSASKPTRPGSVPHERRGGGAQPHHRDRAGARAHTAQAKSPVALLARRVEQREEETKQGPEDVQEESSLFHG